MVAVFSSSEKQPGRRIVENNIADITIIGASGKREDHTLGNIFSILDYKDLNIKLYTDTGVFTCIHKNQKIESFKGQQVSIFTADNTIKITCVSFVMTRIWKINQKLPAS